MELNNRRPSSHLSNEVDIIWESDCNDKESVLTTSSNELEKALLSSNNKVESTVKDCYILIPRMSLNERASQKLSTEKQTKYVRRQRGVKKKPKISKMYHPPASSKNSMLPNEGAIDVLSKDTGKEKFTKVQLGKTNNSECSADELVLITDDTKNVNSQPDKNPIHESLNKETYNENQFNILETDFENVQLQTNNDCSIENKEKTNQEINKFSDDNNIQNENNDKSVTVCQEKVCEEVSDIEMTINNKNDNINNVFEMETDEEIEQNRCIENIINNSLVLEEQKDKENDFTEENLTNTRKTYPKKNYPKKQTYCVFCKQLRTNIARHFEIVHTDEIQVQNFIQLEKNSPERKKLIEELRNKGNFEYNIENSEKPIVKRRRHKLSLPEDVQNYYLPCSNCTAYFSHQNLARHYNKCIKNTKQSTTRSIKRNARNVTTKLHKVANNILKRKIIPPMRRDKIFNAMRKDKLILLYGNHLTAKYTGHQEYMIRNHLRFLSKFYLAAKELCPTIKSFSMLFRPKYFDIVMEAVLKVAGLNEDTGGYRSPKSALQLVHNLKVCANVLQGQFIREENKESQKRVQRFLKLLNTDAPGQINKPALKSLIENKRKKLNANQIKIPISDDITKFKSFLLDKCDIAYKSLIQEGFQYESWKILAEVLLLYIVVFNRKRSGEIHKILVEDFKSIHKLSQTSLPELYEALSEQEKNMANCFYKLVIRGKLDSAVTVFVPEKIKLYLDHLYSLREDANVPNDNPYLFGLPGRLSGERYKLLETCFLMRKYTKEANLQNPEYMRTTLLRKHLATKVSALNLVEGEQKTVMDFMGHQERIHKRFYRQEVVTKDLMMTRILDQDMNSSSGVVTVETEDSVPATHSDSAGPSKTSPDLGQNERNTDSEVQNDNYADIHHVTPQKQKRDVNKRSRDQSKSDKESFEEPYKDSGSSYKIGSEASDSSERSKKKNSAERKKVKNSTRRVTWSTPERHMARRFFGTFIEKHTAPSEEFCKNVIDQEPILRNRTPIQLKAWVYNQIKNVHYRDKKKVRSRWTTPQKAILREVFAEHIQSSTYPSNKDCLTVVSQNPELKNRSVAQIKSFIQHSKKQLFT